MERDEVRKISKEVRYPAWVSFKWILVILIVALVIGTLVFWGLTASGIITMNIKRKVVQHSQQYVETKINLLNKLYSDWEQLEAEIKEIEASSGTEGVIEAKESQQKAIVLRIKTEAKMIPEDTAPTEIRQFIETH